MKTIGLIGGMSWESTAIYYRLLNEIAREKLGGLHSASLLLRSFDFAEIEAMQAKGDWNGATRAMEGAAVALRDGGADFILICTNTMHKMADEVSAASGLEVLHIADASAAVIAGKGCTRPLLLATRYTMEQDFYKGRLKHKHGLDVVVPDDVQRTIIHEIIYEELCRGMVRAESRAAYLDVIASCVSDHGIDSVILGCTEIGMLITDDRLDIAGTDLPAFDTTAIHARAAIEKALG